MHDHLYHKGNDFTIKYPSSALEKNSIRGADRIAPLHWPDEHVSEGEQHALGFQVVSQAATYQERRRERQ